MTRENISQNMRLFIEKSTVSDRPSTRKAYKKPILESLELAAERIAGGDTSMQLENSGGLIGS